MTDSRNSAAVYYNGAKTSLHSLAGLKRLTDLEPQNAAAWRYLALCHENEYLVLPKDKAKPLYEKAAALGDDVAMYRLGLMYEQGDQQDLNIAADYYAKAAQCTVTHRGGSLHALARLEELAKQEPPIPNALIHLGYCYQHGFSELKENFTRAKELYIQAHAINPELVIEILNLQEKTDVLKNIIHNKEFIKGTHKGLSELKSIMTTNKSSLEQWLDVQETINKRLRVVAATLFGNMYREPVLARLYKAVRENDLETMKDIEKSIPVINQPAKRMAPKII